MLNIGKWLTVIEEVHSEAGIPADHPLRKIAVCAVVNNPYAGRYSQDLSAIVDESAALGQAFGRRLVEALAGEGAQSYGKSAIVGLAGEQEHANAFLTTAFANQIRAALGGGKAWISSTSKRGAPGASIDVPLACKDALYVRSHYDTLTVCVPDAPAPDEVVVIVAVANRGRLNARLGGVKYEEIQGEDGLR